MARALPTPPLSSMPLAELQALIQAEEDAGATLSPKQWLDRAQHEADLAVIAERRNRKEEMFVAYSKCYRAFVMAQTHRDTATVKKQDPNWATRVKTFKETADAYLARAKDLKETLKTRDIERGEGSSMRPTPSRGSSTGPDVHNMGSIADRMAALSGKGMNAAPIPSAKRASVTSPLAATTPATAPPATNGRARAGSSASSNSHTEKPARPKGPSIPPKPAGVQGPRAPVTQGMAPSAAATGSRSRSNSKAEGPVVPQRSGEPRSPIRSQTTLPSIPHSPTSRNLSAIERSSTAPEPSAASAAVGADDSMDNFERQFPSLSEFGKQFDSDDFQPRANGLIGPFEHEHGVEEDDETSGLNLPDVSGLPDPDPAILPSVPNDLPSATSSSGLPPPPSRPDRLDTTNSGRPDDEDGPGAVEPPPDSWNSIKRVASEPTVTAPGDRGEIQHADAQSNRPEGQQQGSNADPSGPSGSGSSGNPKLPPKPKFPITNAISPETVREYVLNPTVKMLLLDVRSEEEYKKGYVAKEYEAKGYYTAAVWLDPTVLTRSEMNSTRLESSLSLLPEEHQNYFLSRTDFDIVVVYDSSSSQWPRPSPGQPPSPLTRLWGIIFEHEFVKKLQRTPVLLTGGYEAWSKYQQYRQSRYAGVKANGNAETSLSKQAIASPPVASDSAAKRANRDMPVYQAAEHRSEREEQPSRSYVNRPPVPPPRHSPTYPSHSHSQSQGAPSGYHAISPPAPASIHPGPGSRRRSDYVEHSSASYAGSYGGGYQSPPSAHGGPLPNSIAYPTAYPTGQRKIDYPAPQQLNRDQGANGYGHGHGHGHGSVPQPPPPAQGHGMERHDRYDRQDQRMGMGLQPAHLPQPAHSPGPMRRAPSMRAQEMMAMAAGSSDEIRYWNDIALGLTGLKNLGNTCYMNSTLQCLSATYPFSSYFLDGTFKRSINEKNPLGMGGKLAIAFADLIKALWKEEYSFLSPVTFRKNIISFASQFSGTDQHDSQEFLSFVLDGLHEDLNRIKNKPPPVDMSPEREARLESLPPELASEQEWDIYRQRNDSFIVDLFQGQYRNRLECLTCHKTSTTYDTFMYMSLPVPAGKKGVVVQELIDEFVKAEIMQGTDAWNCPRCKTSRRASKTLTISRLPPVLLIQLKRFTTQNGVFWDKSETPVIFPIQGLDLTRYVPSRAPTGREDMDDPRTQVGPFRYDLYGVSNHMGTLSSGHYTAYVKSSKGWMYCEDSKISRAQEKDVCSRPAYILFYKRIRT